MFRSYGNSNNNNKAAFLARPGFKQSNFGGPGKKFGNPQWSTNSSSKTLRRIPPPANVPSLEAQQRRFAASHLRSTNESTQWNVKSSDKNPTRSNDSLWGPPKETFSAGSTTDFPDLKTSENQTSVSSPSVQQRIAKAVDSLSNWKVEQVDLTEQPSIPVKPECTKIEVSEDSSWLDVLNLVNYEETNIFEEDERVENNVESQLIVNNEIQEKACSNPDKDGVDVKISVSINDDLKQNECKLEASAKIYTPPNIVSSISISSSGNQIVRPLAEIFEASTVTRAQWSDTKQPKEHYSQKVCESSAAFRQISNPISSLAGTTHVSNSVNQHHVNYSGVYNVPPNLAVSSFNCEQHLDSAPICRRMPIQTSNLYTHQMNNHHHGPVDYSSGSLTIGSSNTSILHNGMINQGNNEGHYVNNMQPSVEAMYRQQREKLNSEAQRMVSRDERHQFAGPNNFMLQANQMAAHHTFVHPPPSLQQQLCYQMRSLNDVLQQQATPHQAATQNPLAAFAAAAANSNFDRNALLQHLFTPEQLSNFADHNCQHHNSHLQQIDPATLHLLQNRISMISSHYRNANVQNLPVQNASQLLCSSLRPWMNAHNHTSYPQNDMELHDGRGSWSEFPQQTRFMNHHIQQANLRQQSPHGEIHSAHFSTPNIPFPAQCYNKTASIDKWNSQIEVGNSSSGAMHGNVLENIAAQMRAAAALERRQQPPQFVEKREQQRQPVNIIEHEQFVRQLQDFHLSQHRTSPAKEVKTIQQSNSVEHTSNDLHNVAESNILPSSTELQQDLDKKDETPNEDESEIILEESNEIKTAVFIRSNIGNDQRKNSTQIDKRTIPQVRQNSFHQRYDKVQSKRNEPNRRKQWNVNRQSAPRNVSSEYPEFDMTDNVDDYIGFDHGEQIYPENIERNILRNTRKSHKILNRRSHRSQAIDQFSDAQQRVQGYGHYEDDADDGYYKRDEIEPEHRKTFHQHRNDTETERQYSQVCQRGNSDIRRGSNRRGRGMQNNYDNTFRSRGDKPYTYRQVVNSQSENDEEDSYHYDKHITSLNKHKRQQSSKLRRGSNRKYETGDFDGKKQKPVQIVRPVVSTDVQDDSCPSGWYPPNRLPYKTISDLRKSAPKDKSFTSTKGKMVQQRELDIEEELMSFRESGQVLE